MRCPNCETTGTLTVRPALSAQQIGTFSLAGAQIKVPAAYVAVLECSACDLRLTGHLEGATLADDGRSFTGGHFVVADPGEDL